MTPDERDLFDLAPAAYVVFDRSGTILRTNRAFARLVGAQSGRGAVGQAFAGVLTVGGRIYFETHVLPNLDLNGHVDEVALDVVRADGARIPVLLSANVRRADTGESGSTVRAVLFEARERRHYEQELLRATREAEAARRRATDLSRTLQQTLIPPGPPAIPGLDVHTAYRPAGDGREVGGDFFDVFKVADREWCVVLGDVAGKGIPAATITAFVRHTVRDLAMLEPDPADLLRALDRALQEDDHVDRFCTMVVLRVAESGSAWRVRGAVGGHPLPLLGRTDGTVAEVGVPGSLVGILDEVTFERFEQVLTPEDFVVLFTDGVTEARGADGLFGAERLARTVAAVAPQPQAVTETLVRAALEFQDGDASDDIAVLTIHPRAVTARTSADPSRRPTAGEGAR